MKLQKTLGFTTLALLAGYLMIPPALNAATNPESVDINKLLADAKAEAVELKTDAINMESFTRMNSGWENYASQLEMIRGHVNNSGKLLTKLKDAAPSGALWQQTAISRIEPYLKEMADNTTTTINYLNSNQSKVRLPEFRDLVKANAENATSLEALIRDIVDYGNTKERFERLSRKLELDR